MGLGHRMADDPELTDMMQPLDVAALERALQLQIAEAASRKKGMTSPEAG